MAGLTLLRFFTAGRVGLGDVEAYYWTWSRELAPGFLDHGPVVALLIRLGTAALGTFSTLAVRLPFILISTATVLGCAALAARLARDGEAALWAVLALLALPAFLVAGGAANPDVPFVALVVALMGCLLALRSRARAFAWLALAGLLVGLAISTKLFGLLLLLPLLLAAARLRPRLVALPLALGLSALVALPSLLWNAQHGWPSFRYHLLLRHSQPAGPSLLNLAKLVGGQLAYVSPILLVGLLVAAVRLWRDRRSPRARSLLECALPILLAGFVLILLVPSAEPHWPLAGYLPLLVWLSAELPTLRRQRTAVRGLLAAGLVLAFLLGAGVHLHILTDLGVRLMPASYQPRFDLSNELRGWPEVAAAVEAARQPSELVAGCHYTVCSQLAFAARGRFPVACPSARLDQFDFFEGGDGSERRGLDLLYVLDERFPFAADRLYRCARVVRLSAIGVERAGRVVRRFWLQRCVGFSGLREQRWPPGAVDRS